MTRVGTYDTGSVSITRFTGPCRCTLGRSHPAKCRQATECVTHSRTYHWTGCITRFMGDIFDDIAPLNADWPLPVLQNAPRAWCCICATMRSFTACQSAAPWVPGPECWKMGTFCGLYVVSACPKKQTNPSSHACTCDSHDARVPVTYDSNMCSSYDSAQREKHMRSLVFLLCRFALALCDKTHTSVYAFWRGSTCKINAVSQQPKD